MGFYILIFIFGLALVFMVYLGVQESEKRNAIYDSMADQMKDNPECQKIIEVLSDRMTWVIDNASNRKELVGEERSYYVVKIGKYWVATGGVTSTTQPPESGEKEYNFKCQWLFDGIYGRADSYIGYDKICGIDELAPNEIEPLKRVLKREWAERFPQVPYLLEFYKDSCTFLVFEITSLYGRRSKKTLMS